MKIEEAIEILTLDKTCDFEGDASDLQAAIQLAIEALKAWKQFTEGRWMSARYDLPGETKD